MNITDADLIKSKLNEVITAANEFNSQSKQLEVVRTDFQEYVKNIQLVDGQLKAFIQKCDDYVETTRNLVGDSFTAEIQSALDETQQTLKKCQEESAELEKSYAQAIRVFNTKLEETSDNQRSFIGSVVEANERQVGQIRDTANKSLESLQQYLNKSSNEQAEHIKNIKEALVSHLSSISEIVEKLSALIDQSAKEVPERIEKILTSFRTALLDGVSEIKDNNTASVARINAVSEMVQKSISSDLEKIKDDNVQMKVQLEESRKEVDSLKKTMTISAVAAVVAALAAIISFFL